jgi:ATP-dependent helicase HrpB
LHATTNDKTFIGSDCRSMYPVLEVLPALQASLASNSIVILQAPPGAGKSTILPLELIKLPWLQQQKAIMLEPRRLAAKSVAQRMASLLNEEAGNTIGYRVRFDTKVSAVTKLEVVTEGILTRMLQSDNSLEGIGLLIFDEFHERSLQADLALALSLQAQQVLRPDLKILIMSATLEAETLKKVLGDIPVVTSEGKQYPVSTHYLFMKDDEPLAVRVVSAIRKALRDETGDILVFLPGAGEIQRTAELLEETTQAVRIHTLYADLPYRKQEEALLPDATGARKVVLSTSIAETSLTIEGIKVVIDSGYARVPRFDPRSGLTRLETVRVTKDAADQRRGRAGRLGPGICYRLWSENLSLVPQRKPEILEADLSSLVLELAQWGVKSIHNLSWITVPPTGSWNQAKELLEELGAIKLDSITEQGKEMVRLPTHPRIASMLLYAKAQSSSMLSLACDVASVLEERDPLPKESGADILLRVEALRQWRKSERVFADKATLNRIEKLSTQWQKLLKANEDNTTFDDYDVGRLLIQCYPERIAQQLVRNANRYKLSNGRVVKLPEHDTLVREPWLCVAQVDAGQQEGKVFLAAPVKASDLFPLATQQESSYWDSDREMITAVNEWRIGNTVLQTKPLAKPSAEQSLKVWSAVFNEKGLRLLDWNDVHEQWQARVLSLKKWRSQEPWPDVQEEKLINSIDQWLFPYIESIYKKSDLVKLDLISTLASILPWELSAKLNSLAPEKIQVPSGSMIQLGYKIDGSPPVMEVRLQEMFGLSETPAVNEGRNKIMLHLLSPGYKPVQVTQDLKSFWQTTYHEVRKELRMRYPKHHWPEDPWTAEAVRGVKRNLK